MFYTIYKITNKLNAKFYIGMHKTNNLNDGYMGSGKLIRRAIKKHGKENFTKSILHVFSNAKEMKAKEAELVTVSEETYNLCDGGHGGWSYVNRMQKNLYGLNGMPGYGAENLRWGREYWDNKDPTYYDKLSSLGRAALDIKYPNGTFFGKTHSEESKIKMSEAGKLRTGPKNSQYGTVWISNSFVNQKIKSTDPIPEGWHRGRK